MPHFTTAVLEAGLDHVRESPWDHGSVELVVCRPGVDEREVLTEAALDLRRGLIGDTWRARAGHGGGPDPDKQLTIMNNRAALLVAGHPLRRELAGDQLFVDFDVSLANLPAGTRLAVGSAVVEVTAAPHLGCVKFAARFGGDALRLVNSRVGRELRLRGMNTRVVVAGTVRPGDTVRKLL